MIEWIHTFPSADMCALRLRGGAAGRVYMRSEMHDCFTRNPEWIALQRPRGCGPSVPETVWCRRVGPLPDADQVEVLMPGYFPGSLGGGGLCLHRYSALPAIVREFTPLGALDIPNGAALPFRGSDAQRDLFSGLVCYETSGGDC